MYQLMGYLADSLQILGSLGIQLSKFISSQLFGQLGVRNNID